MLLVRCVGFLSTYMVHLRYLNFILAVIILYAINNYYWHDGICDHLQENPGYEIIAWIAQCNNW